MFAVVETGGKQYRVSPGQAIRVEKLPLKPGEFYRFERVLMLQDDAGGVHVGRPEVKEGYVLARVRGDGKNKKIIIFMFKRRKNSNKKRGHRQVFTELEILGAGIGPVPADLFEKEFATLTAGAGFADTEAEDDEDEDFEDEEEGEEGDDEGEDEDFDDDDDEDDDDEDEDDR